MYIHPSILYKAALSQLNESNMCFDEHSKSLNKESDCLEKLRAELIEAMYSLETTKMFMRAADSIRRKSYLRVVKMEKKHPWLVEWHEMTWKTACECGGVGDQCVCNTAKSF
jgi:hypothetical protein